MRKRTKRGWPSHATAIAYLALFVAIGGSAFAATQLPKNSVGTRQLKKNAVKTADIARNAVRSGKLAKEAIRAGKLAKDAVTGEKVADGSLSGADIDQGSLHNVRAANVTPLSFTEDESCSPALPLPSGVTSSRPNTGICLLTFSDSVADCAINATVHFRPTKPTIITAKDRTSQVLSSPVEPNEVAIVTLSEASPANLPFDLVLVC